MEYQCVINDTFSCPYNKISGKLCSACKMPDFKKIINQSISPQNDKIINGTNKKKKSIDYLKVKWYNWLCLNQDGFKLLELDERNHLVNYIVNYIINNDMDIFNDPNRKDFTRILVF